MTGSPTMADARAAAEAGMQQALEHAESKSPEWGERALAYLKEMAQRYPSFSGWYVTRHAEVGGRLPAPPTLKAWGPIFKKAARLGYIEMCGYTKDPYRHASPCPVWRSLICVGEL